jgi:hypothetical protein
VGPQWAQQAYVKASNTGAGDRFGASVAISGDGTTLVVGANAEQSSGVGINGANNNNAVTSGAAYAYARPLVWTPIGIDDCSGNDRGNYSVDSVIPLANECDDSFTGTMAVCWDQLMYTNDLVPGSVPGCTYKSLPPSSCPAGTRPGYAYVCR